MLMLASLMVYLPAGLFVIVCVFMTMVILIQKPRGGGLVGAFGGQGAVQQAFGSKVGDMLTWFTVFCFVGFLVLAMALTWIIRSEATGQLDEEAKPAPAATAPAVEQPATPAMNLPAPPAPATPAPAAPAPAASPAPAVPAPATPAPAAQP